MWFISSAPSPEQPNDIWLTYLISCQLSAFSANGNLSTTEKSIASVLGIFLVLGLLYGFLRMAGIKLGGQK